MTMAKPSPASAAIAGGNLLEAADDEEDPEEDEYEYEEYEDEVDEIEDSRKLMSHETSPSKRGQTHQ